MPRTETYLLRLTRSEKTELADKAKVEGCSIAKLIRWKLGLDLKEPASNEEVVGRELTAINSPRKELGT